MILWSPRKVISIKADDKIWKGIRWKKEKKDSEKNNKEQNRRKVEEDKDTETNYCKNGLMEKKEGLGLEREKIVYAKGSEREKKKSLVIEKWKWKNKT